MKLEIEIAPDLEHKLQQVADRAGVGPSDYVLQLLLQNLNQPKLQSEIGKRLSAPEAVLLERINRSLTPTEWQRYHSLQDKRQAEILTHSELQELIAFSDRLEQLNAERLQALVELARIRQSTVSCIDGLAGSEASCSWSKI